MSAPKRYTFEVKEILDASGMVCSVGIATLTHPMGKYVSYEDYARLKAEVERLDNNCDYLDQKLDDEMCKSAMLCGHIMRLQKAGDEVLLEWSMGDENGAKNYLNALVIWNAAKDGTSDR